MAKTKTKSTQTEDAVEKIKNAARAQVHEADQDKKEAKSDFLEGTVGGDNKHHFVITETEDPKSLWYVVHTYSGHESKVAQTLVQRVNTMHLNDKVHEILIPTQDKILIKQGKKSTVKEQVFPGYMLVKMILTDDAWLAVRTTQGVTSFIGIGNKPTALPPREVDSIKKFVKQAAPKFKTSFNQGEAVKIVDGPFADFLGQIDNIDEAKGKATVLVSIFGRETPVELDFLQIAKV